MPDIFNILKSLGNVDITRYSDSEILTPQNIVSDMVDLLPQEVFNPDTTFLDPAVKSGRFLKEIYNRLFNSPLLSYMNEKERREHILHNQLFGLATSPTAAALSRAMLYDTAVYRGNIVYADNYIARVSSSKGKDIKRIIEGAFEKDMTFDVVIGNPPYQNGNQSIYPYFIEAGLDLAPKVCMITRNNFLKSEIMKDTRNRMTQAGITQLKNYSMVGDVFSGLGVSVAIFNIDTSKRNVKTVYEEIVKGEIVNKYNDNLQACIVIFNSQEEINIYNKVKLHAQRNPFNVRVGSVNAFGIRSNGNIAATGYHINDRSEQSTEYNITLVYMGDNKKPYARFTRLEDIPSKRELIDTYKVLGAGVLNDSKMVLTNIRLINKHSAHTNSYGMIYYSTDPNKAIAASQYAKTKFFRMLVKMMITSRETFAPYRFSLVPDQDFSSNSDIDWAQTVADIDKQLYKKYNLSQEEIDYIEQTINPYD